MRMLNQLDKRKTDLHTMFWVYLGITAILAVGGESADNIQCLSANTTAVDWFIIYKLPKLHNKSSNIFYYMDDSKPNWTKSDITMDKPGHAVYNTLHQIYKNDTDILYGMYNDETPSGPASASRGHTKGVVGFGNQTGFWLVHSLPKYPEAVKDGYKWPKSGNVNGQSFLCISMDTKTNMDEVGHQLYYNYPKFYDYRVTKFASKCMLAVLSRTPKHATQSPWKRETNLTSLHGKTFVSFAKASKFGKDLYGGWLATRFESDLMVETWQLGKGSLCSNCTGKYKVYNVATISFSQDGYKFNATKDHSKWAVSKTGGWLCIGDINRQPSQEHRPGGTVCLKDQNVSQSFSKLINKFHDCNHYKNCTL